MVFLIAIKRYMEAVIRRRRNQKEIPNPKIFMNIVRMLSHVFFYLSSTMLYDCVSKAVMFVISESVIGGYV